MKLMIKKKKQLKKKSVKKVIKKAAPKKPVKKKKIKKVVNSDKDIFIGVHKTKVRIIGVGGGGGTIVSEIISRVKKADFIVANTDAKALHYIKKAKKFQFGVGVTKGLGTGMNVDVGEAAALEEKEKIEKLFEGQDICVIVASLGGGAGSGAMPVFAKISKNTKCLTYGIFTLPFEFEGTKKMEIAIDSLNKIRPHLNAFSVIPNERIFKIIDKNTPLQEALSAINQRLADNLSGLIDMIYSPGVINIDFADLRAILAGRGKLAYLNTVDINTANKEEAVKKVVSSMLYPYTIKGAKGIVYNIVGNKSIQLDEVSQISKIISDTVNKNAKIIFGINHNKSISGNVKITLLATGCSTKGIIDQKRKQEPNKNIIRKVKKVIEKKPPKDVAEKKEDVSVDPVKITEDKKKEPPKKIKKAGAKKKKKPKEIIKTVKPSLIKEPEDVQVRRNALQVKRAIEDEESELLAKENELDTPAIFRNKDNS